MSLKQNGILVFSGSHTKESAPGRLNSRGLFPQSREGSEGDQGTHVVSSEFAVCQTPSHMSSQDCPPVWTDRQTETVS